MDIHVDGNFWFFGRRHSGKEPLSRFAQAWVSEWNRSSLVPSKMQFRCEQFGGEKKVFLVELNNVWNQNLSEPKNGF